MIRTMAQENLAYARDLHAALAHHMAAAEALAITSQHDAPSGQLAERNAAAAANLYALSGRLLFKLTAAQELLAVQMPLGRLLHVPAVTRRACDRPQDHEHDPRLPPADDYHATSQEGASA